MKKKINVKKLKVQRENLHLINRELRQHEIGIRSDIDSIKNQPARTLTPESIAKIKSMVREIMNLLDINNIGETTLMYKQRELEAVITNLAENELTIKKINRMLKEK